jgi:hypothetical protein
MNVRDPLGVLQVTDLEALLPTEVAGPGAQGGELSSWTLQQIGLSSLQMIQFVTAIEAAFGVEFEPAEFLGLMDAPLSGICQMVNAKR